MDAKMEAAKTKCETERKYKNIKKTHPNNNHQFDINLNSFILFYALLCRHNISR